MNSIKLARFLIFCIASLGILGLLSCQDEPDLTEPSVSEITEWLNDLSPENQRKWFEGQYTGRENRRALMVLFVDIDGTRVSEDVQLLLLETMERNGVRFDFELLNLASVSATNRILPVRNAALSILEKISLDQFSVGARLDASKIINNYMDLAKEIEQEPDSVERRRSIILRLRGQ